MSNKPEKLERLVLSIATNQFKVPLPTGNEVVTAINERDALLAGVGRLREALEFAVKNHISWTALDWRNWISNHARAGLSGKKEGEGNG